MSASIVVAAVGRRARARRLHRHRAPQPPSDDAARASSPRGSSAPPTSSPSSSTRPSSGVFFLLVAFLQIAAGYSPIAAGAASLPVTLLMLLFSARSGALAQRIGPRIPLTVGPLVIALGMLLMAQIEPGRRAT